MAKRLRGEEGTRVGVGVYDKLPPYTKALRHQGFPTLRFPHTKATPKSHQSSPTP